MADPVGLGLIASFARPGETITGVSSFTLDLTGKRLALLKEAIPSLKSVTLPNLPGLEKYAGLTRPAHIHFRVMESLHIPVTTQLYFKGDPFIAKDPWAGHKLSLAIDLKQEDKLRRGVFDIVLARGL